MSADNIEAIAERRASLLREATECFERGEVDEGLEALFRTDIIDRVCRIVQFEYRNLPFEDVSDATSRAIEKYIFAVRDGRFIADPSSYICKSAKNNALDLAKDRKAWVELDEDLEYGRDDSDASQSRGLVRAEAIRLAREIIASLKVTGVTDVLTYIIEAVAQGAEDISIDEISGALGMTKRMVNQNKWRGFNRLKDEALARGIQLDLEALAKSYGIDWRGFDDNEDEEYEN